MIANWSMNLLKKNPERYLKMADNKNDKLIAR
jgi:hypothetical protein